jgi:hypothetical protein
MQQQGNPWDIQPNLQEAHAMQQQLPQPVPRHPIAKSRGTGGRRHRKSKRTRKYRKSKRRKSRR